MLILGQSPFGEDETTGSIMEKSNFQHKNIQGPLAKILQQTRSLIAFHKDIGLSYPLTPKIKNFLGSFGTDIGRKDKSLKKTAKKKGHNRRKR